MNLTNPSASLFESLVPQIVNVKTNNDHKSATRLSAHFGPNRGGASIKAKRMSKCSLHFVLQHCFEAGTTPEIEFVFDSAAFSNGPKDAFNAFS